MRFANVQDMLKHYSNIKGIKIFLDDIRIAPEGWTLFRETEISKFLEMAEHASVMSLDHDLGENVKQNGYPITGYDIMKHLEKCVAISDLWSDGAPVILVHSANPVGRGDMEACVKSIYNKVGMKKLEYINEKEI